MQALRISNLSEAGQQALSDLYRTSAVPRLRTRAQMILLSAELGLKAPEIAPIVWESESTVQRWLKRYQAEGIAGLQDALRSGRQAKVTWIRGANAH
jgi:transposase